jgi:hypothetical protein
MRMTVRLTSVSWWPRTWGIFAQSKGFRSGGEIVHHSLGKHSLHPGPRQSRHVGRVHRRLVPSLCLFQGLALLGLFPLLVAFYFPPYFSVQPVYSFNGLISKPGKLYCFSNVEFSISKAGLILFRTSFLNNINSPAIIIKRLNICPKVKKNGK